MHMSVTTTDDRSPRPARTDNPATLRARDLTVRLAVDETTRSDAYRLRHESYLSGGYIEPQPGRRFSDPYDERLNCTTAVIYRGEQAVASVRVCLFERDGQAGTERIPACEVFDDVIANAMRDGWAGAPVTRAVEINRLVRHPDHATDQMLVFALFRVAGFMILRHDTDVVFSCVRSNHVSFYERLRFHALSEERQYHLVKFPTRLLACPRAEYDVVRRTAPLIDPRRGSWEAFGRLLSGARVPVFPGMATASA